MTDLLPKHLPQNDIETALANIRVVLVNPQHPGNIGGAARAMLNMGLTNLVLVNPLRYPDPQADARAAGADRVLHSAKIVDSLQTAVSDCLRVYATTARHRDISVAFTHSGAVGEEIVRLAKDNQIALVFGPERTGLTNEHLELCHAAIEIPANPGFTSLNLAAAVQIIGYEIRQQLLKSDIAVAQPREEEAEPLASHSMMEGFFEHLERHLADIGYLDADNPRYLMRRLRRMYARMHVAEKEIHILRGIMSKTEKLIKRIRAGKEFPSDKQRFEE